MRTLTLCTAGFCLLVSVGTLVLLFIYPPTSVSLTQNGAGSLSAAAQSWAMLLLIVFAFAAAAAVLASLWRVETMAWPAQVSTLVVAAALVAIVHVGVSRSLKWLGPWDIPWLNITIVTVAGLYFATWQQWKRRN